MENKNRITIFLTTKKFGNDLYDFFVDKEIFEDIIKLLGHIDDYCEVGATDIAHMVLSQAIIYYRHVITEIRDFRRNCNLKDFGKNCILDDTVYFASEFVNISTRLKDSFKEYKKKLHILEYTESFINPFLNTKTAKCTVKYDNINIYNKQISLRLFIDIDV